MRGDCQVIETMKTESKHSRRNGFSLIEVLITLVIMSVGMLGIAGLYVQSMQAVRTSMFRHHAVTLAGDVADRIRANPRAAVAYADANGEDNNCVLGGANCNPAEMAASDIFLWKAQASESLPGGDVTIVIDEAVMPPSYSITVSWNEPGELPTYVITIAVLGL
jgi:type IV pilus assembly protein PilV